MRILAIEDGDSKWERMEAVIRNVAPAAEISRAKDLYEGERMVEEPGWDLLVLDMSLDVRAGTGRGGRSAHDFTGGLKITGRMFYNECEIATIIVTGFDAFPTGNSNQGDVTIGLEDITRQARSHLGDHLIDAIRFGSTDWETRLADALRSRVTA